MSPLTTTIYTHPSDEELGRAPTWELEVLTGEEVLELGLPCPPDWYVRFFLGKDDENQ